MEYPKLFVEGTDDVHVILHLLGRHGISLDKDCGPVDIRAAGGDSGVLDAMTTAIKASANRTVGFVIDADISLADRWTTVCGHLERINFFPCAGSAHALIGRRNPRRCCDESVFDGLTQACVG